MLNPSSTQYERQGRREVFYTPAILLTARKCSTESLATQKTSTQAHIVKSINCFTSALTFQHNSSGTIFPSSLRRLCFFQEVIQASSQTAENFKISALGVFNTSISDYQASKIKKILQVNLCMALKKKRSIKSLVHKDCLCSTGDKATTTKWRESCGFRRCLKLNCSSEYCK